jgi:uncharacterized phage protein gp47/JayE
MKKAGILLLFVSASGLFLTACASQTPVQRVGPAPATGTVEGTRYGSTRRVTKDGVEYFCERPAPTGSRFIAPGEQCYTEAQLRAIRERDQAFVHRQQALALETNTTAVTRTAISP